MMILQFRTLIKISNITIDNYCYHYQMFITYYKSLNFVSFTINNDNIVIAYYLMTNMVSFH